MGSTRRRDRWVFGRELGHKIRSGSTDQVNSHLYSAIRETAKWNPSKTTDHTHHGGIFNFDFSSDGSLLAAACERKSILLFDPLNNRLIAAKDQAHRDCVNCIRFLDTRTFVSCSDDTTVSIWDVRNLKQNVRTLRGHLNWVKNIDYVSSSGVLLTSGFDGSIYTWDINRYTESEFQYTRVFYTNGLMRTKLTPDASKLIIATAGGYLVVIHDLDLQTLQSDLHGFKPNMYRLMQMSRSPIRQGYRYNHVFTQQKNRVEFISDFPEQDEAEMIASLQVHPQGWCILSRNTTNDENSEWTCCHDIQYAKPPVMKTFHEGLTKQPNGSGFTFGPEPVQPGQSTSAFDPNSNEQSRSNSPSFMLSITVADSNNTSPTLSPQNQSGSVHQDENDHNYTQIDGSPTSIDEDRRMAQSSASGAQSNAQSTFTTQNVDINLRNGAVTFVMPSSSQAAGDVLLLLGQQLNNNSSSSAKLPYTIIENQPRLLNFVEEPNVGRGFIKEVSFSMDGRVIASPYAYGVRLLAYNLACSELCDCVPLRPMELHEIASSITHKNVVVCTRFSPVHCLLVTGCLDGSIGFHQPVF